MYLTIYAQEICVTARLFNFVYDDMSRLSWNRINGVSPAIWAISTLVTSCAVNLLPVKVGVFFPLLGHPIMNLCIKWYGELEYCFGYLKIIGLVVIIVAQVPINLHGKGKIQGFCPLARDDLTDILHLELSTVYPALGPLAIDVRMPQSYCRSTV
jgi:amino acid permease